MTVRTRTGRNVTSVVPELHGLAGALHGRQMVLDGELVAGAGLAADFYALGPRMAMSPARADTGCRVSFVAFDVLHLDGADLCRRPYDERRALLDGLGLRAPCWDTTFLLDADPADALDACADLGLEGFVAKRVDSPYRPGQRSPDWLKLKTPSWRRITPSGGSSGNPHGELVLSLCRLRES